MRPIFWLILMLVAPMFATGCLPDKPDPQGVLQVGEEIVVPDGFELVGYTIAGSLARQVKMFCQLEVPPELPGSLNKLVKTLVGHQVFDCTNGEMGKIAYVDPGLNVVQVTVDPKAPGKFMFVCQDLADRKYYECQPS